MATWNPVKPRIASIESGEKHLYSFNIEPLELRKQGGFLLKINVWSPVGMRFLLHLTDKRIIIESNPHSRMTKLIMSGMVGLAGLAGAGQGATSQARQQISQMKTKSGDIVYSIPYSAVKQVDGIQQYLATFARITFKNSLGEPLVLNAYAPDTDLPMRSHNTDFIRIVKEVLLTANG